MPPKRKAAASSASGTLSTLAAALPRVHSGDFAYLVYEQTMRALTFGTRQAAMANRSAQRALEFASTVAGRVVFLDELAALCPPPDGCIVRSAFAGIGHTGLSMVDENNLMSGSQQFRSLWRFRARVLSRFKVAPLAHRWAAVSSGASRRAARAPRRPIQ